MLRTPASLVSLGSLLLIMSCKDATGPGSADCDKIAVSATISSGKTPTFSWSPACAVAVVLVEADDGGDLWAINMPLDGATDPNAVNKIRPPVAYGVVPTGIAGLESEPAEPLVVGERYNLILWRMLQPNSNATCQMRIENFCLMVVQEFVP